MDTCVSSPPSVFTVEGPVRPAAALPLRLRKRWSVCGGNVVKLLLSALALLALCGAASEIYILQTLESRLETTKEMVNVRFEAEKIIAELGNHLKKSVPSAHVTGIDDTASHPRGILEWESSGGLAFLHEVEYRNRSLVCTNPGMYFVYSKLQLGSRDCPKNNDPFSFYTHGVYKKSPSSEFETELMKNKRRFCGGQGSGLWSGSSFLGGIFWIEQGETVYVKMTHRQLVRVKDGTITFFGLFML
ncbi:tumor necrosis factor ligand superfamily member 14 [Spea bombifrons]|uniref:tumor necrosis factor ligand superfamily member 14 n=1 Tax=Spea bombifrons TaxID=233779 RepID=UPI00234A7EE6|nr:tumor necrosis factor ligand superfamily member 14 [Spea bombifrons]